MCITYLVICMSSNKPGSSILLQIIKNLQHYKVFLLCLESQFWYCCAWKVTLYMWTSSWRTFMLFMWGSQRKGWIFGVLKRIGEGALVLTYQVKLKQYGAEHAKGLGFLFLTQLLGIEAIWDLLCILEISANCCKSIKLCVLFPPGQKELYILCKMKQCLVTSPSVVASGKGLEH